MEEQIRELDRQASVLAQKRARAQVVQQTAAAKVAEVRAALKAEFGIETPEDAQKVQTQLASELATAVQEAQRALEVASGE